MKINEESTIKIYDLQERRLIRNDRCRRQCEGGTTTTEKIRRATVDELKSPKAALRSFDLSDREALVGG